MTHYSNFQFLVTLPTILIAECLFTCHPLLSSTADKINFQTCTHKKANLRAIVVLETIEYNLQEMTLALMKMRLSNTEKKTHSDAADEGCTSNDIISLQALDQLGRVRQLPVTLFKNLV